ncbi:MAG TPA: hypothetical protein VNI61_00730 [Gemmatimonadales bacterium]|nr:hypothetical protein [Gemmatimonadales bacterium]
MTHRSAAARVVAIAGVLVAACAEDVTGPWGARASLALEPVFATGSPALVDFDRARVTLLRMPSGRQAADTVVAFPVDADSVALGFAVVLEAPSETFAVFVRLISPAGDTVFRNAPYPQAVVVVAGAPVPPVETVLEYVGTGANAAALVILSPDTLVQFGDTVALAAAALDSAQRPIPGTPIEWISLDTLRVRIPSRDTGLVVGASERGVARVVARLLTGQADTVLVTAQPPPGLLVTVSGDGQVAEPGAVLPQPLRVRVTGSDGLGVRVAVRFRPLTQGASVADSVVASDSAGYAQTAARLALTAGPQGFEAAVAGVASVGFAAEAVAVASQVVFQVQPGTVQLGAAMVPPVEVAVQDDFGNVVTTWTSPISLRIGLNPGGATLGGTLTRDAVNGVATFDDLTLDQPGVGYTLVAASGTLPERESAPFDVVRPPAVVFAGDSSGGLSSGIFRVNPDGSDRFRLDGRGASGDVHPRWSPGRERAVFTFTEVAGGPNALFVVARTGDTSAVLVSDTSARRARWSPDGVRLAFECGDGFSAQQDVCVIPDVTGPLPVLNRIGDGAGKVFVTDFNRSKTDGPGSFAWDPLDPKTLVVVRDSLTDKGEVVSRFYRVLYDGTGAVEFSLPLFDPQSGLPLQVVGPLDWSSDGSTIVFSARDPLAFDQVTPTGQRLYVIGRDGAGLRQLTKGPAFDRLPVWSPDGRRVLFLRDAACSVDYWLVHAADGAETQVSAEGWCDFNSAVVGHDWSPDGRDLVLVGAQTPGGTSNLLIYRVPAGTTAATYAKDRVLVGRGPDPGGFVTDLQPSWRP